MSDHFRDLRVGNLNVNFLICKSYFFNSEHFLDGLGSRPIKYGVSHASLLKYDFNFHHPQLGVWYK